MPRPPAPLRSLALRSVLCALLVCAGAVAAPARVHAEDGQDAAMEQARIAKVKELRKDLRKWAQGPYADKHKDDILNIIAALKTLGGLLAAQAVLEALPATDSDVRDRAFELIEHVHEQGPDRAAERAHRAQGPAPRLRPPQAHRPTRWA